MSADFPELIVGGVLMAPFVIYAILAGLVVAVLRPLLRIVGFERVFANPPLVVLGFYVIVLAALIATS